MGARTAWDALLEQYADNTTGDITAERLRNLVHSARPHTAPLAPTSTNDETEGFDVGHVWVDPVAPAIYECLFADEGAAAWVRLYPRRAFSLKAHRTASFTYADPDVWEVIPMDTVVAAETLGKVDYTDETLTTLEFDAAGLWYVSGWVRPVFQAGGNPSIVSATRIMKSTDEGNTWVELRCLQSVFGRARGEDEPGTERFTGTVIVETGDWIRLEGRTSNTGLILSGWDGFDNPVSASIETHWLGAA